MRDGRLRQETRVLGGVRAATQANRGRGTSAVSRADTDLALLLAAGLLPQDPSSIRPVRHSIHMDTSLVPPNRVLVADRHRSNAIND